MILSNIDKISIHKKRLSILENQQATQGGLCPPHIIMEISELRDKIKEIDEQNSDYIDKWFYNIEKENDFKSLKVKEEPLCYRVRMPWRLENYDLEVINVFCTFYTHKKCFIIESVLFSINTESIIFYKLLLEINNIITIGRISINGSNIVFTDNLHLELLKDHHLVAYYLKFIVRLNLFLRRILITFDDYVYQIEQEEYDETTFFSWCKKNLKQHLMDL